MERKPWGTSQNSSLGEDYSSYQHWLKLSLQERRKPQVNVPPHTNPLEMVHTDIIVDDFESHWEIKEDKELNLAPMTAQA